MILILKTVAEHHQLWIKNRDKGNDHRVLLTKETITLYFVYAGVGYNSLLMRTWIVELCP